MENIDQQIKKIINKIKRRLLLVQSIKYLFLFIVIGMVMSIAIGILSRFVPIYKPYRIIGIILGTSALLSVVWSFIKIPRDLSTALKADSLGLKERVVTSFELKGNQGVIAQMQKKDALIYLERLDYKKELSLVPHKKYMISFLILLCMLTGLYFIPNPMKDAALKKHEIKVAKKDAVKEVEKVEKKIDENEKLSDWMKLDVKDNLTKLKKELSEAESSEDINKAIQKSSKKLEIVKQEYLNEDLEKVADTFMKNEITKELGKLINEGDKEALLKAMDEVAKNLKNASSEKIKQLSEGLNKLAQELKNNPNLAKALGSLASNLAQGNITSSADAMNEMSSTISQLMENEDFVAAMNEAQQALQQSLQGSNSANSNNGSGENTANGNGQGQGQGTGGGAGSGSGMGQENSPEGSESSGLAKKDENSEKNVSDYDKIFTPKTLGGDGETSMLIGQKNDNGASEQIITEKGIGVEGNSVPYNQVVGEYKSKAYENMENSVIPESMKDLVKSYFSSLEE